MSNLIQHFRYALRQLRKNPGFTVTAVLTLALGIGANVAIFTILDALMLRSLPYAHAERMGTIFTHISGPASSDERNDIDGEQWELLRDNVPALISAVSGDRLSDINLQADSHVQYVQDARISANYLDVLSTTPVIGRNFSRTEDLPNGPKAAILSFGLWRTTFDADPHVIGRSVLLKGEPYTVVGVLPENTTTPLNADVYTSLQPSRQGEGMAPNFHCITRLRDGATWQQADAQINRAWLNRPNRYELGNNPNTQVWYYSVPLQKGQVATLRPQVLSLMMAAGFILLIACANLAGLMLVRVLRRTPELATRMALGASPWQIQKQLWIENLLLALAGGMVGVVAGFLALRALLMLLPEHFLPVTNISPDVRVLAFAGLTVIGASILFGMVPVFTTRRLDLRSAIGHRTSSAGERLTLRQAFLVGEVALTVLLLSSAGLLIHTLIHLETLPPGFNADGVLTARASLDNVRYHDSAVFRKLLDDSTEAMRKIPGVKFAAVGLSVPYDRALNDAGLVLVQGRNAGQRVVAALAYVTPEYFSALQMPLLSGRAFTDADGPDKQHVVIINQTFARKFFPGENPVGLHLDKDTVIVGVVSDVAMVPKIDPVAPLADEQMIYVPATQLPARMLSLIHIWFQPSWIVRSSRPIEGLSAQMQRALQTADPDLPFSGFYRMSDLRAKALAMQRVEVALLGSMAFLALLLSVIGIFGLVASLVTQKTREIGIRIALGSTIREAMVHIGRPGLQASAIGLLLGLTLATGALRVMRSVLYGVHVYDTAAILGAVTTLAIAAFLAAVLPTRRIGQINPVDTLREE
jgi:putative ABC transport system permease protein